MKTSATSTTGNTDKIRIKMITTNKDNTSHFTSSKTQLSETGQHTTRETDKDGRIDSSTDFTQLTTENNYSSYNK